MQAMPDNRSTSRRQFVTEIALSLVTIGYFVFNILWFISVEQPQFKLPECAKTFWLFWGQQQNWRLFSPIVRDINFHTVGIVTLADGYKTIWEAPRNDSYAMSDQIKLDKFRKWSIDSLPWPAHKQFWPDIACWVGRKYFSKENPPVEFSLLLFWTEIPPPEQMARRDRMPPHTIVNHLYTYRYKPGDLD